MVINQTKFKETEIGPIPEEWSVSTLDKITTFISRGVTPSYVNNKNVIVLNQKCIRNGKVGYDDSRFTDPIIKNIPLNKYLKSFDILINSTGQGTLGRVAQIQSLIEETTADSHITIVRPDQTKIDPIFLGHFVRGIQKLIESFAEGSTGQTELSREKVKSIIIPIPSSKEQKQIAEILSSLDDKIELNRKINENLEKLTESLFREWFGDINVLNKYPISNIGSVVVKDKYAIVDGPFGTQMKISEYKEEGVPVIEMGYLEGYPLYKPFKNYISEEKYEEVKRSTVHCGDLIISKTGTLGLLGIMTDIWDKAILVSRLAKITPDTNKVNRYYLFQVLKNFQKEKYWDKRSSGSTMPIINLTHIKSAEFNLPPIEIQNKFGNTAESFYNLIHKNLLEIQNLSILRDSLLPKLMSGKIRVK